MGPSSHPSSRLEHVELDFPQPLAFSQYKYLYVVRTEYWGLAARHPSSNPLFALWTRRRYPRPLS